jgi:signal transduction histidine kinase
MVADRGEIDMILNNLVSNAVKYNREGGRVDVRLTREADRVTIAVGDTGIGLTPGEAGRLFGEFVRIRNEKTQSILGSGLGLSIVRKLACLYGGDATVTSQSGVGSTFTVVLNDQPSDELVMASPCLNSETGLPANSQVPATV